MTPRISEMPVSRIVRVALFVVTVGTVLTVVSNAVVATSVPPSPSTAYEGPGSASPQDAVSAYMTGLAAGDLDAMVSAFAVETFVDHFDLRAYLERVGVYSATVTPVLVPAETPFTRALGVEHRHGDVIGQIRFQFLALADPELEPTEVVTLDDTTLEDFYTNLVAAAAEVELTEVGSFTFVPMADVDPAAAEAHQSEQNQANLESLREVFGADEIADLVVRFTVGEQEFLAFFSVVRYGDAWWVEQLGGNFANLMGIPALRVGAAPAGIQQPSA